MFLEFIKTPYPRTMGRSITPSSVRELGSREHWKLLQFSTDVRPPYFGSFRKSKVVHGNKPYALDPELDYDVDSEAEWEEDEPGEELVSENEEDNEEEEEEEEDGWLVPHGYLSDDEGLDDERIKKDISKKDCKQKNVNPKRPQLTVLDPVLIGPFLDHDNEVPDIMNELAIKMLFGIYF